MASHNAGGDALAKGCLTLVAIVVVLFLVVRCSAVRHHDHAKDKAHAEAVAQARTYADTLARTKGATLSARAARAAAPTKEITVRAVTPQAVIVEIGTAYGDSPLGGAHDLTTCFRVAPPSTAPVEVDCPDSVG